MIKRNLTKRFMSFLLCMVLAVSSASVPAKTVQAAEVVQSCEESGEHTIVDGICTICGGKELFFDNSVAGWNTVNVYFYFLDSSGIGNSMTTWPGEAMSLVAGETAIYSYVLPAAANYVIFNDGTDQKTGDLNIEDNEANCYKLTNSSGDEGSGPEGSWRSYPCTHGEINASNNEDATQSYVCAICNQVYADGGDITTTGVALDGGDEPTCYKAGNGYAIYDGKGKLILNNVTININSESDATAIKSSSELEIVLNGVNSVSAQGANGGCAIEVGSSLTFRGSGTVSFDGGGYIGIGIKAESLMIESGSVNVTGGESDIRITGTAVPIVKGDAKLTSTGTTVVSGNFYKWNGAEFVCVEHIYNADTGKCDGCEEVIVAQAGNMYYTALQPAIDAVNTGTSKDTIVKLLDNVEVSETVTVQDGIFTLDLNDKTLSSVKSDILNVLEGDVSVKNGSIETNEYAVAIDGGTVSVEADTSVTGGSHGIMLYSGSVIVNGGNVSADLESGYGIMAETDTRIIVNGGKIRGGCGVFSMGQLTATGGEIMGSYNAISSHGNTVLSDGVVLTSDDVDINYSGGSIDLSEFQGEKCIVENNTEGGTVSNFTLPDDWVIYDADHELVGENASLKTQIYTLRAEHTHSWSYTASGDTITAACIEDEAFCPDAEQSIILATPESAVYDGTAKEASISGVIDGVVNPTVTYTAVEGSALTDGKPVDAGTYTANMTLADRKGETVTANVKFAVKPATLTVSSATAEGKTYDGTNVVSITSVTLAGVVSNDVVSVDVTGLTGTLSNSNAGTYNSVVLPEVNITGADAGNYTVEQPSEAVETDVAVTITKADNAPTMPDDAMKVSYSNKTVSVVPLPEGWTWQETDKDVALVVGEAVEATAIYTDADKGNYVNESVEVSITREACEHAGGTATCKEKAVCTTCGEAYGEVKPANHTGITEIKDAKDTTCASEGYTGDTYCVACGMKTAAGETIAKSTEHTWDAGVVTKAATTTEKGEKTFTCTVCGETKTEEIPTVSDSGDDTTPPVNLPETDYATVAATEKVITSTNTDKADVVGSVFAKLQLKVAGKNKSVKLTWKKVKEADGYILYGAQCGKKFKKIKTFTKASTVKYTQKKLKKGTYYKYMVVAYKNIDGQQYILASSKSAHAVTTGGKCANPTKVSVKASKITVKKGKTKTIKASYKIAKGKKAKIHIAKFRYESSDTKVATVSKKGKVTGKKKGTCYIYVYAQNGVYKKVKVTVK